MVLTKGILSSPIGDMELATWQGKVACLAFAGDGVEARLAHVPDLLWQTGDVPNSIRSCLRAYFSGEVHAIQDIEVVLFGSPFQKRVWQQLRTIPSGEVRSYLDIATVMGRPNTVRAVGAANSCNPVLLIVPCHRVVGADGQLRGYAGGLERKRWLLEHERAIPPSLFGRVLVR